MKHKVLITSILLWIYFLANSQNKSGLIIYDIKYPNENVNAKAVESRLFFNDSLSIGISYSTNFVVQKNIGINKENEGLGIAFKYGDEKGELIYRNFNTEKITLRFPKSAALDEYTVDDNWIKIEWTIKDEMTTIGKFKCKKAIGDFRGRTYIAWFTEEIALPYGPFKLCGLPGLILEAEDSKKMFLAKMKLIEYPTNREFDVHEPVEKEKKTIQDHVYSQDHIEDFLLEKLNSKAPKGIRFTKAQNKTYNNRKFKTERVYEWEK